MSDDDNGSDRATLSQAFTRIYDEDLWTNGSGPGSRPDNTIEYRAYVERFMVENAPTSVTDLGCGDWQFSRLIDWTGRAYTGLDVVERVVAANVERFSTPDIQFRLSAGPGDLPGGDLLLCKEVLQHLPNALVASYLQAIRRRYRLALITNAIAPESQANREIEAGDWRPLRLDQPPFSAPGAVVFTYYPRAGDHLWRNGTFLMVGDPES